MTILDPCVFIACFRIEETGHEKACKIFSQIDKILVNDSILSEVYTVLLLCESYEQAQEALLWITGHSKIEINKFNSNGVKSAVNFIIEEKSKLSFVDISLLVMQQENNCEIITFNKELQAYIGK